MAIPRHVVDEVRARTDIVELVGRTVTLKRRGSSFVGLCPFHDEKTPSFNVVPGKGIYHCFGCGEGGDAIRFLVKARGMSFFDAVKELAQACGVTVEERPLSAAEAGAAKRRGDLYSVLEAACAYFEATLLVGPSGEVGRHYLAERATSLDTARKYRLGYAPDGWTNLVDHMARAGVRPDVLVKAGLAKRSERSDRVYDVFRGRIVFPIFDDRGRPIAFGGRILPALAGAEAPKYLNSPESEIYKKSQILYGMWNARAAAQRRDRLLVVEGYFDAVSLWQAGIEEVVAPCGTALTGEHLDRIRRVTQRVVALFDSDEAGLNAAVKSLPLFLAAGVDASRLDLPGAKDPDEFVRKHGVGAFEERLAKAEPLVDLVIRRTIEKAGKGAQAVARATEALAPILAAMPSAVRGQAIARASGYLLVHESVLEAALAPPPRDRGPSELPPPPGAPPRWRPDNDLVHLAWLLVHHASEVGPALAKADPAWISDRPAVLEALAALAAGQALPNVLDRAGEQDPDVARALAQVAVEDLPYPATTVVLAAEQILRRLEAKAVDAKIAAITRDLQRCEATGDTSSYGVQELSSLYMRRSQLARHPSLSTKPADPR